MLKYEPSVTQQYLRSAKQENVEFVKDSIILESNNPFQEQPEISYGSSYNLDLTSNTNKVLLTTPPGMFHLMYDTLPAAIEYLADYKVDVIIDIKMINNSDYERVFFGSFISEIASVLNEAYANNVYIVDAEIDGPYKINNYYLNDRHSMRPSYDNYVKLQSILSEMFELKNIEPTQKVYLSRSGTRPLSYSDLGIQTNFLPDDLRISDEQMLEDFFKSFGYEIVKPENFITIKDQARYFAGAKVLAGSTGTGMTNMFFMKPETKILEILSPIVLRWFGADGNQNNLAEWLHTQYGTLAFYLDQIHTAIPNKTRKASDIINYINRNIKDLYIND